ncbi:MAG TPA: hypothetical protein VKU82_10545 [Planctomycetaceae bacterium]|nr:hypothetical protein [Planctomycetaceae bacterium]
MQPLNRRQFLNRSLAAAGALWAWPQAGFSAIVPGVETVALPLITGQERSSQPDIWALEVNFKPVRMIQVELDDPKTGKSANELVWYLAYRAVVRTASGLPNATDGSADRPKFVPEFTLVVEGKRGVEIYPDRVIPAAQAAINKRERYKYKNSVDVVAPLPKITPDRSKVLRSLDGVATWTGIDPDLAFFTIYMAGFSNGYKVEQGPNGEEIVKRRTLAQDFWRPGDRFEQHEEEIRVKDEARWIYR